MSTTFRAKWIFWYSALVGCVLMSSSGIAKGRPSFFAIEIEAAQSTFPVDSALTLGQGFPRVDPQSGGKSAIIGICDNEAYSNRVLSLVKLTHPGAKVVSAAEGAKGQCPQVEQREVTDRTWLRELAGSPVEMPLTDPPDPRLKWAFYDVAGENTSRTCKPSRKIVRVEFGGEAIAEREFSGSCTPASKSQDGAVHEVRLDTHGKVQLGGRIMPFLEKWDDGPTVAAYERKVWFIGLGYHNGKITEDIAWDNSKGWKDPGYRLFQSLSDTPDGWKAFRVVSMAWDNVCDSPRRKQCRKAIRYVEYTWNDSRQAYDEKELPVPSPDDLMRDADKFVYANRAK